MAAETPATAEFEMMQPAAGSGALRGPLEVERLRVAFERPLLARFHEVLGSPPEEDLGADAAEVRRQLRATALRLSPAIAPELNDLVAEVAGRFGLDEPVELYQTAGEDNAAVYLVATPIVLELKGRMLTQLDPGAMRALVGHELGHYLAHGPWNPTAVGYQLMQRAARDPGCPADLADLARRHSVASELTADRFGALAAGDLDAVLRLELSLVSGLASDTWVEETAAYLAQAQTLMEGLGTGGQSAVAGTHPEHALRTYAIGLFVETDVWRELTGTGSGARTLAAVDAELARLLGEHGHLPDAAAQAFDRGGPPVAFHELGLAAAVLVAAADGVITDDERHTIERAFAAKVPDWHEFFDEGAAARVLAETGPEVAGLGEALLRTLFMVLARVMFADGVPHPAEVATILDVGRFLGCAGLWQSLLIGLLNSRGVDVRILETLPPNPLPARDADVDAAFDAFLTGIARRGGARSTLRRILRLLGRTTLTTGARLQIDEGLTRHGITVTPALDEADLDTALALLAPNPAPAPPPAVLDADRRGLLRALGRLRDDLVSGDGRSPAVRLRRLVRGRAVDLVELEQVSLGAADRMLAQLRAGRRARLVDPVEAGAHAPATRLVEALLDLERAHRDRMEETGANDLYLGHPFISGVVEVVGSAAGYPVRGPLLLYPVSLERDARGARGYSLAPRADEPPVVNQALIRLIFNKRRFGLPPDLLDNLAEAAADEGGGTERVLALLDEVGLSLTPGGPGLRRFLDRPEDREDAPPALVVEHLAILGLFAQSNSDLLTDYDELLRELAQPDADVSARLAAAAMLVPETAGGRASEAAAGVAVGVADLAAARSEPVTAIEHDSAETSALQSSEHKEKTAHGVSADPAADLLASDGGPVPVVESDPSQRAVLLAARTATALVVDGPPGTGKSQVIANLVADALRRGERVAVVCEKRAALDVVYQRLAGLGLGAALAVVHDLQDDRRALYDRIGDRVEPGRPLLTAPDAETAAAAKAWHEAADILTAEAIALSDGQPAYGSLLALGTALDDAPVLAPDAAESAALTVIAPAALGEALAAIEGLRRRAAVWQRGGLWRGPEGAWRGPVGETAARPGQLRAAQAAAEAFEAAAEGLGLSPSVVDPTLRGAIAAAEAALAWSARERAAQQRALGLSTPADDAGSRDLDPRLGEADPLHLMARLLAASASDPGLAAVAEAADLLKSHGTAMLQVGERVAHQAEPPVLAALAVQRAWRGRILRFFVPAWWRSRGTLHAALGTLWPERAGVPLSAELVHALGARLAAAPGWTALAAVGQRLGLPALPPTATAAEAEVARWLRARAAVQALFAQRAHLRQVGVDLARIAENGALEFSSRIKGLSKLLALADAAAHTANPLRDLLPWWPERPAATAVSQQAAAFDEGQEALGEVDVYRADLARLSPDTTALLDALAALPEGAHTPLGWRRAVVAAWTAALQEVRATKALRALGTPRHAHAIEQAATRLGEHTVARAELEVERVLARLDAAPLLREPVPDKGRRRTALQATREHVLREVRKRRSLLPLRSFVRRFAAEGLLDVMPAWLLSPETMSVLFPRAPLFDLVIFDEASQCTVESGLPVLLRARRAVIVGDDKQMPPSRFFQASAGEAESEDDEDPEAEPETAARDLLAGESLLTLARERLPHTGLAWHYRCRNEALIAFSNHAFYGGGLRTIPATATPSAPSALRWVEVPEGRYADGSNAPEAEVIVDLMAAQLALPEPPSVGVVTFNLKQRRTILDAIDARRARDPEFEAHWQAASTQSALDARPFVKNLESVQGDERDVILFSLAHAPRAGAGPEATVPARFGPLNRKGGERRLNVAISRARQACYVVASFKPDQLRVGASRNAGPALFKAFLEFAWHSSAGRTTQARALLDQVRIEAQVRSTSAEVRPTRGGLPEWLPLSAQVAAALEAEGAPVAQDVGVSDFRVPVAVLDPHDRDRYRLAILIDEAEADADPHGRHVHRQAVLRLRGWDVLRVTAADWARRRAAVLEAIFARVPDARGCTARPEWQAATPVPQPTPITGEDLTPDAATERAAWAAHVADPHALRTLQQLESQGELTEAEVAGLMGGPRRARGFYAELAALAVHLPFGIDVLGEPGARLLRVTVPEAT